MDIHKTMTFIPIHVLYVKYTNVQLYTIHQIQSSTLIYNDAYYNTTSLEKPASLANIISYYLINQFCRNNSQSPGLVWFNPLRILPIYYWVMTGMTARACANQWHYFNLLHSRRCKRGAVRDNFNFWPHLTDWESQPYQCMHVQLYFNSIIRRFH